MVPILSLSPLRYSYRRGIAAAAGVSPRAVVLAMLHRAAGTGQRKKPANSCAQISAEHARGMRETDTAKVIPSTPGNVRSGESLRPIGIARRNPWNRIRFVNAPARVPEWRGASARNPLARRSRNLRARRRRSAVDLLSDWVAQHASPLSWHAGYQKAGGRRFKARILLLDLPPRQ